MRDVIVCVGTHPRFLLRGPAGCHGNRLGSVPVTGSCYGQPAPVVEYTLRSQCHLAHSVLPDMF